MSWTLTTSGACIAKAGAGANSDVIASYATLAKFSDDAEATLNTLTRYDWIANYAGIGTNFKGVLSEAVSDIVAMRIVTYDMSGYRSRVEAQVLLDVLRDDFTRMLTDLKEKEVQEVMD